MKPATILPTPYLSLIKDEQYHMCLAHLIGKDEVYTEFYKNIGKDTEKYLIMDNGVIEGDQRPIEELVKKALMLQADELILPDVFLDKDATLAKSYYALNYVKGNFPIKIMAVPQGKNLDEWLECAIAMIDWDIDCIGVPKVLTKIVGRDGRLEALKCLGNKLRGLDIHLLGCWTTPIEATLIERAVKNEEIRPVRGIDSAIAYVFSRAGILISDSDRPSGHIDFSAHDADTELLKKNIKMWKDACEIADDGILKLFR